MGRNLKLTDQGNIQFFEGTGGGVNKVTLQAGATLTADYTLTWPDDDGAANTFLKTDGAGVLSWGASTATLQSSYDNGGKITTAGGVPVEIEVGAASANVGLLIDQDDDFKALDITKDGTGAGDAIAILNSGTGKGIFIDQDGAAIGLDIDQDGAGIAVQINQATGNVAVDVTQAGDAAGLNLLKSGTGVGDSFAVENDGTGKGVFINQDGAGIGLDVDQDGAAIAVQVNQASDNTGLSLFKAGTGAGDALAVENDGTGKGVFINQDGAGIALDVDQDGAAIAVQINQASANTGIALTQVGAGIGLDVNQDGAATAVRINQATANAALDITQVGDAIAVAILKSGTGVGKALVIENDGTADGVFIDQDGAATALSIDSEATASPLIDLAPVTGNTRGDINFSTARLAAPTSPSDGDIWYFANGNRFEALIGTKTVLLGGTTSAAVNTSVPITISSGAITSAAGHIILAAETGTTDDLDSFSGVTGATAGDMMILRADSGDTITVKDGVGNIRLDGGTDKVLNSVNDVLLLMFTGSQHIQISFSNNTA